MSNKLAYLPGKLVLTLNKDMTELPAKYDDGDYLLLAKGGWFSVRSYCYTDGEDKFTDGDMPLPRSDFVAWAQLPEIDLP